jgi:hypothetical protein
MSFDWNEVQPGDVIAWTPGKLTRRVLVEQIDGEPMPSGARFVWGVEVTRTYGLRMRRGAYRFKAKPFWIHPGQVQGTGRGGRIPALQARLAELRKMVSR